METGPYREESAAETVEKLRKENAELQRQLDATPGRWTQLWWDKNDKATAWTHSVVFVSGVLLAAVAVLLIIKFAYWLF